MELPPGIEGAEDRKGMVVQLQVALYRSKQGAFKWYQHLCGELTQLGFTCAEADWGVFMACIRKDMLVLASHVNDCTVTGSSAKLIRAFKAEIGKQFKITDLGPISWLLGMKVTHSQEKCTISLSQESFIEAIIMKYNFADVKPAMIPMDPSVQYSQDQCPTSAAQTAEMK